jgi:hypothetical protein
MFSHVSPETEKKILSELDGFNSDRLVDERKVEKCTVSRHFEC